MWARWLRERESRHIRILLALCPFSLAADHQGDWGAGCAAERMHAWGGGIREEEPQILPPQPGC